MSAPTYRRPSIPPGTYRAARALRWAGTISLVLIILFVGAVAYSAVQVVKDHPSVGQTSVAQLPNETVEVSTTFSISNPGFFPIQQFHIQFRVLNETGALLVSSGFGPTSIPSQGSLSQPVSLFLPMTGPGVSLLTVSQTLRWDVWGNATYGYLFPISLDVATNRSWGAPFANLTWAVGTPMMQGGVWIVPITLSFSNDASFSDVGNLNFQVVPTSGADCAQGSFTLNVPSNTPYDQTQNVPFSAGCNPAGGTVTAQYVTPDYTIDLPPEPIP